MSDLIEVKVPDIGDFQDVPVIEVLVKAGDTVAKDDSLVTLESDKATMEVPSPAAGAVQEIRVKVGDKVSEGVTLLTLRAAAPAGAPAAGAAGTAEVEGAAAGEAGASAAPPAAPEAAAGAAAAPAAMAPTMAPAPAVPTPGAPAPAAPAVTTPTSAAPTPAPAATVAPTPTARAAGGVADAAPIDHEAFKRAHASPAVRRFARELGVDLSRVSGSGPHGRIVKGDVEKYVKAVMGGELAAPAAAAAPAVGAAPLGLIPWPKVDFARFGPVEAKPLSRIKKISGANLHRNWVMIPHVTSHDDADITELEAFRVRINEENAKAAIKVTMLAFLVKACVAALQRFPELNASLDGESIVYKRYWHIGFAADTPNGLVVPVIRDADRKGVLAIAKETGELAAKAREGKLAPADMQGGTFSISSLGGIGGTYFTPIINAPEVAILGVCRSTMRPFWDGKQFAPRLILPLSLSWDHRVIDGAAAARFNAYLASLLADFRRTVL